MDNLYTNLVYVDGEREMQALTAMKAPARLGPMAVLTIRDLDDEVRDRLRVRAASHGRSMEAEVRAILADVVSPVELTLADALTEFRTASGGVELLQPSRTDELRDPLA